MSSDGLPAISHNYLEELRRAADEVEAELGQDECILEGFDDEDVLVALHKVESELAAERRRICMEQIAALEVIVSFFRKDLRRYRAELREIDGIPQPTTPPCLLGNRKHE